MSATAEAARWPTPRIASPGNGRDATGKHVPAMVLRARERARVKRAPARVCERPLCLSDTSQA